MITPCGCWGWRGREIARAERELLALQREDGGWAGNPHLSSEAFATGEALVALAQSGAVAASNVAYRRGLDFLLDTIPRWFVVRAKPRHQVPAVFRKRLSFRTRPVDLRRRYGVGRAGHRAVHPPALYSRQPPGVAGAWLPVGSRSSGGAVRRFRTHFP